MVVRDSPRVSPMATIVDKLDLFCFSNSVFKKGPKLTVEEYRTMEVNVENGQLEVRKDPPCLRIERMTVHPVLTRGTKQLEVCNCKTVCWSGRSKEIIEDRVEGGVRDTPKM